MRAPVRTAVVLIWLCMSLLVPVRAGSETICSLGSTAYYDAKSDANASPDALRIAKGVAEALCGGPCDIALMRNPTVGNAMTVVAQSGEAKIVYNPQFLKSIDTSIGDGAVFGILAHEAGHVVDRRQQAAWIPSTWDRELRADAWAACAIARSAVPDDKKKAGFRAVLGYPSPSHPSRNLRVEAMELGYHTCGGMGDLPRQVSD